MALLRAMVPDLFERPGSLLYVGACHRRCHCSKELLDAGNVLTALEVWEPFIEQLKAHRVLASRFKSIVLGDVTKLDEEHISAHQLGPTLKKMEAVATRTIVLASPWGRFPEGEVHGNPHNAHRWYVYPEHLMAYGYQVAALGPMNRPGGQVLAWKNVKKG